VNTQCCASYASVTNCNTFFAAEKQLPFVS
jgi:hypothetical protein